MLALELIWKMVAKIVIQDKMDILSMDQCIQWDTRHQQDGYKHDKVDVEIDKDSDMSLVMVINAFGRKLTKQKSD